MPAYVVSIRRTTRDQGELAEYARKAPGGPTAPRPAKRLATSSGEFRSLLGTPAEGMSILQFENVAAAEAWFHSDHYQEALGHLLRGAEYEMYLVGGDTEVF